MTGRASGGPQPGGAGRTGGQRPPGAGQGHRPAAIKSLSIPPAWMDDWICPHPQGHLRPRGGTPGDKQYRYHPRWRAVRDAVKYDRMIAFSEASPASAPGSITTWPGRPATGAGAGDRRPSAGEHPDPRGQRRVPASEQVVRADHVAESPRGHQRARRCASTSGQARHRAQRHPDRPPAIKDHQAVPGHPGPGVVPVRRRRGPAPYHRLGGCQRRYLQEIAREDFTAKDFRTWAGTVLATLLPRGGAGHHRPPNPRRVVRTIEQVAPSWGIRWPCACMLRPPCRGGGLPRRLTRPALEAVKGEVQALVEGAAEGQAERLARRGRRAR